MTPEEEKRAYALKKVMDAWLRRAGTKLEYQQGASPEFKLSLETLCEPRNVGRATFTTIGNTSEMMKTGCKALGFETVELGGQRY